MNPGMNPAGDDNRRPCDVVAAKSRVKCQTRRQQIHTTSFLPSLVWRPITLPPSIIFSAIFFSLSPSDSRATELFVRSLATRVGTETMCKASFWRRLLLLMNEKLTENIAATSREHDTLSEIAGVRADRRKVRTRASAVPPSFAAKSVFASEVSRRGRVKSLPAIRYAPRKTRHTRPRHRLRR